MMVYLLNVLLAVKAYFIMGLALAFIANMGHFFYVIYGAKTDEDRVKSKKIRGALEYVGLAIIAIGLVLSVTATSVTPKNVTFDIEKEAEQVRQITEAEHKAAPPIQDIMRKNDMDREERKKYYEGLIDYKKDEN